MTFHEMTTGHSFFCLDGDISGRLSFRILIVLPAVVYHALSRNVETTLRHKGGAKNQSSIWRDFLDRRWSLKCLISLHISWFGAHGVLRSWYPFI